MRKLLVLLMIGIFGISYSQKLPTVLKTGFSKEALNQKLENEEGKSITIQQILDQHKGKVLVIDFWAGWCRDCLKALPKAKELEENNKNIDFVFLSLDRSKEGFDKSLERFEMKDKENYWFASGWKTTSIIILILTGFQDTWLLIKNLRLQNTMLFLRKILRFRQRLINF